MKKRNKFTRKHARNISFVATILLILILITPVVKTIANDTVSAEDKFIIVSIAVIVITIMSCIICHMLYIISGEPAEQEIKKVEDFFLNKEEFIEIIYTPSNIHTSEGTMISKILQYNQIKFFAKLCDDGEITLSIRDKDNVEICSEQISNYYYFNSKFRKNKSCDSIMEDE